MTNDTSFQEMMRRYNRELMRLQKKASGRTPDKGCGCPAPPAPRMEPELPPIIVPDPEPDCPPCTPAPCCDCSCCEPEPCCDCHEPEPCGPVMCEPIPPPCGECRFEPFEPLDWEPRSTQDCEPCDPCPAKPKQLEGRIAAVLCASSQETQCCVLACLREADDDFADRVSRAMTEHGSEQK